jgi:hypothetical protein
MALAVTGALDRTGGERAMFQIILVAHRRAAAGVGTAAIEHAGQLG